AGWRLLRQFFSDLRGFSAGSRPGGRGLLALCLGLAFGFLSCRHLHPPYRLPKDHVDTSTTRSSSGDHRVQSFMLVHAAYCVGITLDRNVQNPFSATRNDTIKIMAIDRRRAAVRSTTR